MKYPEDPAPWDDGEYRNGCTDPPKSHRGFIAVLLIAVILLIGVSTSLGFSNLQLFQQLQAQQEELDICEEIEATDAAGASQSLVPVTDLQPEATEATESTEPRQGLSLQEIYTKCSPSVVSVTVNTSGESSTGVGIIWDQDGYILTNYHIIDGGEDYTIQLSDGRTLSARLVGEDAASDLAVLYVKAEDLTGAEIGDSEELQVGDSVVAIGDPLGVEYRGTMTEGIICAINRDVTVNGRTTTILQTNAVLSEGNAGGPLINQYGQVVGINLGVSEVSGLGFSLPISAAKDIASQLINQGYVSGTPWLGIRGEGLSTFYQRYYRLPAGLYISEVEEGSAADRVGIQKGDILLSVNGTQIYSQNDLDTLLYTLSAGDQVTVVIYRSGYTMQATVTLDESHSTAQPETEAPSEAAQENAPEAALEASTEAKEVSG